MNQWNASLFFAPKLHGGLRARTALATLIATGLFSTASSQVFQSGTITLPGLISDAGARPDTEIVAEQYLLAGTASRGCGESQVAVNPIDPNEIAVSAMCQQHQNEGKFQHNEREFERTTRATITEFAVTRDRGLTWTLMEDPMRAYFHRYRCLDPFAAFAPDGTMILGCESHFAENPTPQDAINQVMAGDTEDDGSSAIIWSTDGGRTFSDPVAILGSYMPKEILGPYVSFADRGAQGDAPKIRVDMSTSKLYVNGNSMASDPPHRQTVFRASKDRGRTWGMVYAFDAPEWPGAGASYDVAHGLVGAAYIATSVPASLNAKCPCRVWETSSDDGKNFVRSVLPASVPTGSQRGPGGMVVVANPTKAGAFSVLITTPNGIEPYSTEDAGKNWMHAPIIPNVPQTQAAMLTAAYSPQGVLAMAWRALYPVDVSASPMPAGNTGPPSAWTSPRIFQDLPQRFEIWSAISRDSGRIFTAPQRVSTERSPGVSRRRSMSNLGSDFISVALDQDFVHLSWFDDRSGFRAVWYGRIPLRDFK